MHDSFAADRPSIPRERLPLLVYEGANGMRAYLAVGVSTLAAIMAAHRLAAHGPTARSTARPYEIASTTLAPAADRAPLPFPTR
jgi:hypothetical protein